MSEFKYSQEDDSLDFLPAHINNQRLRFLLREERIANNLTQEEMGVILSISPSYVSAIENGKRSISAHVLRVFHDCFHYSYDFLLATPDAPMKLAVREKPVTYGKKQDPFLTLISGCSEADHEILYRMCQAYLLTKNLLDSAPAKEQ